MVRAKSQKGAALPLLLLTSALILTLAPVHAQTTSATSASAPAKTETATIKFAGNVVDDETGAPIEKFTIQWGWPSAKDEKDVAWGGMSQTSSHAREGAFSVSSGVQKGTKLWVRIIAEGYLAQPVTPAPLTAPDEALKLTVRMRRGAAIQGIVLDDGGAPVKGAQIQLVGEQQINVLGNGPDGKPAGETPQFYTNVQGRFRISGASDNQSLIVTAPSIMAWQVTIADPSKEATIRLPEPATLKVNYDIPGAPATGDLRIELKTWDMPAWKHAEVMWYEHMTADKPTENTRITPGTYDIARIKQVRIGDFGHDIMCDRATVTFTGAKTTELNFVRKTGAPITGTVKGLGNIPGAFITVCAPGVSGDPRNSTDEWKLPRYDALATAADGSFKSETIPPGTYTIVAEAYGPDKYPMNSGIRLPDLLATATVTIPDHGDPAPVTIEMKPLPEKVPTAPATRP